MTHSNGAQTVQTCQTRSVCKPRPRANIRGSACIRGNTVTHYVSKTVLHRVQMHNVYEGK